MCALQSLASGLQDLLDYEGDVESEMMCNFTIGYTDMFGSSLTKELKENGAEITVTNENRQVNDWGGGGGVLKGSVIFYGRYTERLPFLPKMVHKRVRVWT